MDGQTSGALYFAQKFMAAGREEDASAVREQLAGVREAATALRDSPDAVPENRALAEEVLGRVDGLDTGFGRVAQLRQAAFMLFRESLEPGGPEMREVISALIEKALGWDDFKVASFAGQTQENVMLLLLRLQTFMREIRAENAKGITDAATGLAQSLADLPARLPSESDPGKVEAISQTTPPPLPPPQKGS